MRTFGSPGNEIFQNVFSYRTVLGRVRACAPVDRACMHESVSVARDEGTRARIMVSHTGHTRTDNFRFSLFE